MEMDTTALQQKIHELEQEILKWKSKYLECTQNVERVVSSDSPGAVVVPRRPFSELTDEERLIRAQSIIRSWIVRRKFRRLSLMLLKSPMHRGLRRRCQVVRGLVDMEVEYSRKLNIIVQLFLLPLKAADERGVPIISKAEIFSIFSTIETIKTLSNALLRSFEKEMEAWPDVNIIKCFSPMIPTLISYSQYIENDGVSVKTLGELFNSNMKFKAFIEAAESNPKCGGIDLLSLLQDPLRIIPKYIEKLKELLEYTPITFSEELMSIDSAIDNLKQVYREIKQNKKEHDSTRSLVAIEMCVQNLPKGDLANGKRKFIKEGALQMQDVGSGARGGNWVRWSIGKGGLYKERYLFILSDRLLLCKIHRSSLHMAEDIVLNYETRVEPRREKDFIITPQTGHPYVFRAGSAKERDEWISAFFRRFTSEDVDDLVGKVLVQQQEDESLETIASSCTQLAAITWPVEHVPGCREKILKTGLLDAFITCASQRLLTTHKELEFSNIEVGEYIAEGAAAKVYKAVWNDKTVAVKLFDMESLGFDLEEFRKEVALMCILDNPYTVPCYGACTDEFSGKLCIVSEYMSKGTLRDFIIDNKQFIDNTLIAKLARDIAKGVKWLHSMGLIHRDLKSANVLINNDMTCKLIDFGTVTAVNQKEKQGNIGTSQWMAPEMLEPDPHSHQFKYNEKADVFSFGIIMWELVTAEEPYKDMPIFDIPEFVIRGERLPIPPSAYKSYAKLIKSSWAADPSDRPSMATLERELIKVVLSGSTQYLSDKQAATRKLAWAYH